MKIMDRYLLRHFLAPFGYVMAGFCLLAVLLDLFDRFPVFLDAGVDPATVAWYYLNFLFSVNGGAPFIVVVLPIAMFLAALYALINLGRHNELTAMRASGVSLRRLMVPFLMAGLLGSLLGTVAQEIYGPGATQWTKAFVRQRLSKNTEDAFLIKDHPYHAGVARRQWLIGVFDTRRPGFLRRVKVTQNRADGSMGEDFIAERAEWLDGAWWFYGFQRMVYDERGEPVGPLPEPSEQPLEMRELAETPDDFLSEMRYPDLLSSLEMFRYLDKHPDIRGQLRARRTVDIHARLAIPWSCMALILLSVPAGAISSRRNGALRSVGIGIALLFAYYMLLEVGLIFGKRDIIAPWLAGWLPNLVFFGLGGVMTWRLR